MPTNGLAANALYAARLAMRDTIGQKTARSAADVGSNKKRSTSGMDANAPYVARLAIQTMTGEVTARNVHFAGLSERMSIN
jgi:basic membrane lipoprotein Med (substrate-binding protein (PBP1-ABC) superfamily)